MNIIITNFTSPFSFYCLAEKSDNFELVDNPVEPSNAIRNKKEISNVTHGQYVAVLWKNIWTRGLVTMESQFLIWLIDFGFYLRPNEKTIYVDLPAANKKFPSKVFEASIHGVAPVDKILTDDCVIKNEVTNVWNAGSIEKAQSLIANAFKVYFVPVALMSTKNNDVVLGDLYLEYKDRGIVNIIGELELWPVFLQRNKAAYIENLSVYYTSRRKHRACLLKPAIADYTLPIINLETSYTDYCAICDSAPELVVTKEYNSDSEDGSTVLEYSGKSKKNKSLFKLTPAEIEKYSNMIINICGREYNILNVLINKTRDLNMCEQYKNHDHKSVGRACSRKVRSTPDVLYQ